MARVMDYEVQNLIGDKLRKYRIEKNLSQKELSAKLETLAVYICRGSISRIEKKERTVTDFELKAFAQILNVEIADLFD